MSERIDSLEPRRKKFWLGDRDLVWRCKACKKTQRPGTRTCDCGGKVVDGPRDTRRRGGDW